MTRKQMRLAWIGAIGLVLSGALALTMFALRDGISFAMSPAELKAAQVSPGQRVRLFGLVEEGSVKRGEGLNVAFNLSLEGEELTVNFNNVLPDLFREGQGIIAEGMLDPSGQFTADTVLAKHDENYVPREFADKLKEDGLWRGKEGDG
ncbi:cytochrome c maturation protein CcmE [Pseudahrensia aquimaris]|uniref:Cytochrome c-type biogenesis protein CcmE n=1 Tax=Pseudahrensia aquimaris TaxID=744461 RepID=A0ABW3FG89_9HYPH